MEDALTLKGRAADLLGMERFSEDERRASTSVGVIEDGSAGEMTYG
jgi:hypothetical protein